MNRSGLQRIATAALVAAVAGLLSTTGRADTAPFPVVFVSRQIPPRGSVYWDVPRDMPGVGAWSRFRPAAPGRLLVVEPGGTVRVLVDGRTPRPETFNLIDVNAPDVSYDGTTIVFAGLTAGAYDPGPVTDPGAWRLYAIRVDGSGLRQITTSDQRLDMSQFGSVGEHLRAYDDTDPAWLPDGRIVFSSTRWPAFAQYGGVRATNLHVVNADGSGLYRITAERNGADRPLVDPVTGRIVFARWWRNHRFATDDAVEIADPVGGYKQRLGLTVDRASHVGGSDMLWRNAWQIASINPDGTELAMWGGAFRDEVGNHMYGGAFSPEGDLFANFFPMHNMSEAAGFGGVRHYARGAGAPMPVLGVTSLTFDHVSQSNPTSYGIYRGSYAGEPDVLPDGRLVVSWAKDVGQDYGLYLVDRDGANLVPLADFPGTTELRARVVRARPRPPVVADRVSSRASLLPPTSEPSTFVKDGTFVFDALNVYGNAPVDVDIVSAPPVGSAAAIRFFLDHQRTSPGSFPNLDWPILLATVPVNGNGSVRQSVPASVPLFEQLRSENGTVPLTSGVYRADGAAHVAGMNYGPSGSVSRCIGCHAGHSMIPVPPNAADARWSNLAPGATVTVSSTRDPNQNRTLIDRRVMKGEAWRIWTSSLGDATNQWVQLVFPAPILVRSVRLYNPRADADVTLAVLATRVTLFSDAAATAVAGLSSTGRLDASGTPVAFNDVRARAIRVNIDSVAGTFEGRAAAGLAEIEVIAAGIDSGAPVDPRSIGIVR